MNEVSGRSRVVIVGGGFTGAAVAYHLSRRLPDGATQITVVEPRQTLGAGLAYSTREPAQRINVPAARMSLDTTEPEQFARWLAASGIPEVDPLALDAGGGVFPQRGAFGRYVAAMLAPMLKDGSIVHRRARATGVRRRGDGRFAIALSGGDVLGADILVLATTHPLPAVPVTLRAIAGSPGFVADAYDPEALSRIANDARVLVVGNGLTGADVVATLDRLGHRGPIVSLSRNGLRSRGHAPVAGEPWGDFTREPATTALALSRRIRREIERAQAAGASWHVVLDAVRIQGRAIWRALPEAEKHKAVRHLRAFWDVHRFRIAPQVQAVLDRLSENGRLVTLAARLHDARPVSAGLEVAFRRRGASGVETRGFDAVINTTGPAHRSIIASEPARNLHEAGLIVLDPVGLGLATAETGLALDEAGRQVPGLFIAGPLARGTFGELMGLPQVTEYAEFVAARIAQELPRHPLPPVPLPVGRGVEGQEPRFAR